MNFWQQKILPSSWRPKSTTNLWMGYDNEKSFAANPIPEWKGVDVVYKYNSDGFRTHELSDFLGKEVNIALGCSFTEGMGLPIENVWTSLIEQRLNTPLLNLGLGAGAPDTVARILTNISGLFKIQKVFILWPEKHRFEFYHEVENKIEPIGHWNTNENYFWNQSKCNSFQRLYKNQNIVRLLAKQHDFETIEITVEDLLNTIPRKEFARDGVHYGIKSNIEIADWFLSLIKSQ